jgi:glycerol-3-phosphate dehydrogenase
VVLNAQSAASLGAEIRVRTRCVGAERQGDTWQVRLRGEAVDEVVMARALINAAGPRVKPVLQSARGVASRGEVRLVKGSHIVVPRIHDRRHAYILQNPDRRVVFLIPYERDFTLIGTTDVPVDDVHATISDDEVRYLCEAASRYAERPVLASSVVWSYSGVRPLYDDGAADPSAVTRDYHLELDRNGPPLVSVFGGKITTYRRLAEQVLEHLAPWFPPTRPWTATRPLPGGDLGPGGFDALFDELRAEHASLPAPLVARMARRHGTLARELLAGVRSPTDLGRAFGGGLYEREVRWFMEREWARDAEDILWRRTKCGLHMSAAERDAFAGWLSAEPARATAVR